MHFSTMKLTLLGIFFISFFSFSGFTQENTYQIINGTEFDNIQEYKQALNNADMDAYRFIHERRRIIFESGVIVELLSVDELKSANIPVKEERAKLASEAIEFHTTWRLVQGKIVLVHHNVNDKKRLK